MEKMRYHSAAQQNEKNREKLYYASVHKRVRVVVAVLAVLAVLMAAGGLLFRNMYATLIAFIVLVISKFVIWDEYQSRPNFILLDEGVFTEKYGLMPWSSIKEIRFYHKMMWGAETPMMELCFGNLDFAAENSEVSRMEWKDLAEKRSVSLRVEDEKEKEKIVAMLFDFLSEKEINITTVG